MTYYDQIASGYDELHGEEQLRKAKIILSRLNPHKDETLLDVGCGPAGYLDIFECEATGIDPSKGLVARYQGKHIVIVGSAEKLPFPDHSFDFVISITAIQNFSDVEKGLKEMKRVGKGKFALSVLKKSPKFSNIKALIEKLFDVREEIEEDKDIIFIANI